MKKSPNNVLWSAASPVSVHASNDKLRRLRSSWILLPLLSLLPLTGLRSADDVIARSGTTEMSVEDFVHLMGALEPRDRAALVRNPEALKQTVNLQIVRKIVLKEALSKKWDKRPEALTQIEQLRQNFLVESYLKSIAGPPESFPSPAEVKTAYEAAKESLRVPKQYRLGHIFIAVSAKTDKAADEKIRARLEPITKQPDSFAAFARTESEDKATAARGGEIGWVTDAQIQAEIRTRIASMAKNAVSEPFRLNDGWHLVKLFDIKESYIPSLDDVKDSIARQLRTEKTRLNIQAYLAKLLKESPVSINEISMAQQTEQLLKENK